MQHQALGHIKTKVHCPCSMCESSKRRKHLGRLGVPMKPCYLCEHLVCLMSAGLQVKKYKNAYLCESRCNLADENSYIWYKNQVKDWKSNSKYYSGNDIYSGFISCAVKGHEDFPSPLKCEFTPSGPCFQSV